MSGQHRARVRRQGRKLAKQVDQKAFAAYLAMTLLIGAARIDSSPEQLDQLKELPDMLREGAPLPEVADRVREIMGQEWMPGPEWREQIEALAPR